MNNPFVIEKEVPLPERIQARLLKEKQLEYIASDMVFGDSVELHSMTDVGILIEMLEKMGKKGESYPVFFKKETDPQGDSWRVWRIA